MFASLAVVQLALAALHHRGVAAVSPTPALPWVKDVVSLGKFPRQDDKFHFLPCTRDTVPPPLDDDDAAQSWAQLYDPDPSHWSWTQSPIRPDASATSTTNTTATGPVAPYSGHGLYLCGYLDVPLDPTNAEEKRIVRLAVTKLQVSGLAGTKSERTIVINPGGPGGSGTAYAWSSAVDITRRLSGGAFDVLAFDPRGVNATQPKLACFPHNSDRDRWELLVGQHRAQVAADPRQQLLLADAFTDAMFAACRNMYGDLPRFMGTGMVARDLEQVREALGEPELTGYLVSYGSGIGQTWANMFPNSVGRVILDGIQYVKDQRELGGYATASLDNVTDLWKDGFLGECLKAGPDNCALAKMQSTVESSTADPEAIEHLSQRLTTLLESLIHRPIPAYTPSSGPSLVTYSGLVQVISSALYWVTAWPMLSKTLWQLDRGNSTLAASSFNHLMFEYEPDLAVPAAAVANKRPSRHSAFSDELSFVVICADSWDAPLPYETEEGGLAWWDDLWANVTAKSWITGNGRFFNVVGCRHYNKYWPRGTVGAYRGDLDHTLRNPLLLISTTYDPATPLRNGRRLLADMGSNARLIVHHGYGHLSKDPSRCTNALAKAYILEGKVPGTPETACYADKNPYLWRGNATAANATSADNPNTSDQEEDLDDEDLDAFGAAGAGSIW
ncbi:hypothetical protein P8C59_000844 [Phyllachora maydis]|uniref:AB hydrolase-1 domain-containing protein n=1 Tax=Phyllachora maydis TaxID=1825666 RepID=A0AAD9M727_9PEZI|nr:hypothetical protein P8C59_000844 [Phyllachora maydis]